MLVDVDEVLKKYRISRKYGCLIDCQTTKLPDEFQPWIHLNDSLHLYVKDGTLRERILSLPILSCEQLHGYEERRLAHVYIITLVSSYMWCKGKDEVPLSLPKCLSFPLLEVSRLVGLPPVVCHASVCSANWRLINAEEPFSAENLDLIAFKPLGTRGNAWFFMVHAEIEKDFAEPLFRIVEAILRTGSNPATAYVLQPIFEGIKTFLRRACLVFKKLPIHLTPKEFYHELRPYLWGYNEGRIKEKGIIMEGHEHEGTYRHAGASGAQGSTLALLDAFLKVKHTGSDEDFLVNQKKYIPREHKELIEWVSVNSPVDSETEGRKEVLYELKQFRSQHLRTVAHFIITQMKISGETGTGGTPFMKFLRNLRSDAV